MTRTLLTVCLLSLCSCAADVADPKELSAVASVMLVQGEVKVASGTSPAQPAAVGDLLVRGDTVWTGPGSAAILHLRNNHLVRVDEDLQLPVDDIILLDAPATELDASRQLAELLYPEERQVIEGVEQAERVSGWQSRLRAGQSVGTVSESDRGSAPMEEEALMEEEAPTEAAPMEPAGGEAPGGKREAPETASVAAPEPEEAKEAKKASEPEGDPWVGGDDVLGGDRGDLKDFGGGLGDGAGGGLGIRGRGPGGGGLTSGGKAAPAPLDLDALTASTREPGALRTCLVDWAGGLPVPVAVVELRVTVRDGRVARLGMGGGLMPPACARDALVGRATNEARADWKIPVTLE